MQKCSVNLNVYAKKLLNMNGEKERGSELEFTGKVGILPHFRNSGIPFLSRLCNYAEVVRIASDGQNA